MHMPILLFEGPLKLIAYGGDYGKCLGLWLIISCVPQSTTDIYVHVCTYAVPSTARQTSRVGEGTSYMCQFSVLVRTPLAISMACMQSHTARNWDVNVTYGPQRMKKILPIARTITSDDCAYIYIYSWLCPCVCVCVRTYVCDGNGSRLRALPDVL